MSFSQVIGHGRVVSTLQGAIRRGSVHHAWLIAGPAGVGRATLARIFAQALICQNQDGEACGQCMPCQQMRSGNHPNVRVMGEGDEKAIKVEEVRETIRWASLKTVGGGRRVCLILRADRLGPSGANAFLKTLEEPPPATVFVMTASGLAQMLPTVRSRCQKLSLSPLTAEQVAGWLVEHKGVDPASALGWARLSGGSIGAALALSEEGAERRSALAQDVLGVPALGMGEVLKLAEGLAKSELGALEILGTVESLLRDVAVERLDPGAALTFEGLRPQIRELALRLPPATHFERFRQVQQARSSLQVNIPPALVLQNLLLALRA